MRRRRRVIAALAVTAMCAPGTWLRTHVSESFPTEIALEQIAGPSGSGTPQWRIEGVWHYHAEGRMFGGYSAMLALGPERLRAFSDRGTRFTFTPPDRIGAGEGEYYREVARQLVEPRYSQDLWDIESATRDPVSGDYWLAFEYTHAVQRYSIASQPTEIHAFADEVEWGPNSGLEAMVRLADGRFVAIPEGRSRGLIYPSDPAKGVKPQRFVFESPAQGYAVTDFALLPDGRILLLMRDVVWGLPPFDSLIAIADPPQVGSTWRPEVALRFDGIIPRENYEGLAVSEEADGTIIVWVISDDNFSVQQRTLLVKLAFDPAAAE